VNPSLAASPVSLIERELVDIPVELSCGARDQVREVVKRTVTEAAWSDIETVQYSASMQCCGSHRLHEAQALSAQANRERISRDRIERERMKRDGTWEDLQ
jgi:hypothetical protein